MENGRLNIILLALVFVVLLGGVFSIIYFFKNNGNIQPVISTGVDLNAKAFSTPTPTPDPFASLTIPYLRQKTYQSNLAPQVEYSETSTYTSFLTSYNSDGLKINGLLTQPKGQMPAGGWPAIVFVHGYIPPTQYRTTEKYVDYVDYLARNGFVVFKIDLRGHGNSEGQPGGGYYSSDYVIDTLNAYAALQGSSFVNPKQIGLWGHSMAGNVTFRALAAKPDIPALVEWAGAGYTYADLREYGISDNSYRPPPNDEQRQNERQKLREEHGDPDSNNDFWQQVIPTNYLKDVSGAIEIHHAIDDPTVSIKYSRNLIKVLDSTSIPHQLYEYPSGGHNISGPSFGLAMQRTVQFFKDHLTE